MPNYENIRPYAEFAHEAAQHGGVDSYLNQMTESSYALGIMEERSTESWKAFMLTAGVIIIWEAGKAAVYYGKRCIRKYRAKKVSLLKETETAKAEIKKKLCAGEDGTGNVSIEQAQ